MKSEPGTMLMGIRGIAAGLAIGAAVIWLSL
jgi:hypothetical protein